MSDTETRVELRKRLWNVDNAEWMKERKKLWAILRKNGFKDFSAKELKVISRYFLDGTEFRPSERVKLRLEDLSPLMRVILAPVESISDVKTIYLKNKQESGSSLSLLYGVYEYWFNSPPFNTLIDLYLNALMDKNYCHERIDAEDKLKPFLAPSANELCGNYLNWLDQIIVINNTNWLFYQDLFEYFLSALPYFDCEKKRDVDRLRKVLEKSFEIVSNSSEYKDIEQLTIAKKVADKREQIIDSWNLNATEKSKF